jgi:hypothetical protein
MPATYQRTVQWTGENTGGANYNWIDVNGAETQGWITRQESSTTDVWNFTISDNNTGATRTANYEVRHWTWTQGTTDTTLSDTFTITQYADSGIEVTTTAAPTTAAPTTAAPTTAAPTTAPPTTAPPTTAPPTTAAPTTSAPSIYTLTYDGNQATGGSTSPTSGPIPLTIAANGFTRTGYSFVEWNTDGSGTGSGYGEGASWMGANATLYAIWQQNTTTAAPIAQNVNFQSASKTLSGAAGSFVDVISRDSGTGSGVPFTYTYLSGSTGAGAGKIYWATDQFGATQTSEPTWITGVSGGFGTNFGGIDDTEGSVTVTYTENS